MNVRNTFAAIFGFCAALALAAPAQAQITDTATISFGVQLPNPVVNLNNLNFGDRYVAVNHPSSSASATIVPAVPTAGITHVRGSPGTARLIPIDTTARNTVLVDISSGIPGAQMALSLTDDNTGNPYLVLTGETNPADAVFRVDTWTFIRTSAGGSLTGFSPSTGAGTITLDGTGAVTLRFGATLRTVPSGLSYSEQAYSGVLRVTVNY